MKPNIFRFKKFQLDHSLAAHKIGTDGVLLGAWASQKFTPDNILDVGSGSGLIAFMMAQRFPKANITGIELDLASFNQSISNLELNPDLYSPNFIHADFLTADFSEATFDLILSNPPFFKKAYLSGEERRDRARHEFSLPHSKLVAKAKQMLSPRGKLSLILPTEEALLLIKNHPLHLHRICFVKNDPGSATKRIMLELGLAPQKTLETTLCIRTKKGEYSSAYKNLTQDFYLNF